MWTDAGSSGKLPSKRASFSLSTNEFATEALPPLGQAMRPSAIAVWYGALSRVANPEGPGRRPGTKSSSCAADDVSPERSKPVRRLVGVSSPKLTSKVMESWPISLSLLFGL